MYLKKANFRDGFTERPGWKTKSLKHILLGKYIFSRLNSKFYIERWFDINKITPSAYILTYILDIIRCNIDFIEIFMKNLTRNAYIFSRRMAKLLWNILERRNTLFREIDCNIVLICSVLIDLFHVFFFLFKFFEVFITEVRSDLLFLI